MQSAETTSTKHEMSWMNKTGDTKIMWSRDNPDEVDNARRTFNELVGKGYAAFKVKGKDGEKGEQIREFDPAVEKMILVPQMRGG